MADIASTLPAPGRWAIGKVPREELETLISAANAGGLHTAWLGPEAGFLSNLSLYENLELLHDWQNRPGPFSDALRTTMALLELAPPDWLHSRPSQQPRAILQEARLLRLALLAPDIAIIEPADAERLLQLPPAVFSSLLNHSRLLLRGLASPEWPALPGHAMLTDISEETPAP